MAVYHIDDYRVFPDRGIFFDANVLIYLFWPRARYGWERDYARMYKNLKQQGNPLYVDFLVISEVINRIIHLEYKKVSRNTSFESFKEFRDGEIGHQIIEDVYTIVEDKILNRFLVSEKQYSEVEIARMLSVDDLDFTDKAIVTHCQEESFVLLTNDKDFGGFDVDIMTANPRLINA